jgi:hypothetical protein
VGCETNLTIFVPFTEEFILTEILNQVGIRFDFKKNIFVYRQYFGRLARKEYIRIVNEDLKLMALNRKILTSLTKVS